MSPKTKIYRIGENYVKVNVYNVKDLIEISDKFEKNRTFDTLKDVFYDSLKKKRHLWKDKKRTYEDISKRLALRIVNEFIDLLCDDLIKNEVEFVFNRRAKEKNRLKLKVGYLINYCSNPNKSMVYNYGGVSYVLRVQYPRIWPYSHIGRRACFSRRQRARLKRELELGRRYFNSHKEKILSTT